MAGSHEAIVYGHLCLDKVPGVQKFVPGSPTLYIGNTLDRFGVSTAVASPYGADYPREWLAPGILLIPDEPTTRHTLIYENRYDPEGNRTQLASHDETAISIPPDKIDGTMYDRAKAIIVCPILDNIPVEYLREIRRLSPNAVMTLLPQGYFREITDMGQVMQQPWHNARYIIPLFDTVILSELDGPTGTHDQARRWSNSFNTNIIVTQAANGSTLYRDGSASHILPFPIEKEVHPTGAGDVFAAAVVYDSLRQKNMLQSVVFANAAAAIHVSGEDVTLPKVHERIAAHS